MRERPDERADDQHERRVKTHVLIHDFLDRELGFFRRDDQFAHTTECRVCSSTADFDLQNAGEILRSGKNFVARFFVHGQRFAGDSGLVEGTLSIHNQTVGRDVVAGTNSDDVADGKLTGRNFFLATVFQNAARFGRREFDERFNRITRAFSRVRSFDDFRR